LPTAALDTAVEEDEGVMTLETGLIAVLLDCVDWEVLLDADSAFRPGLTGNLFDGQKLVPKSGSVEKIEVEGMVAGRYRQSMDYRALSTYVATLVRTCSVVA
jgi:hypothetical protein